MTSGQNEMNDSVVPAREPGGRAMPTAVRHEVLALLTSVAAIAYLARNAVGVAESTIRADLGLSLEESGWFMAAFFWSYALVQVPGGTLAQHRGTRFALTLFAVVWSVAAIGTGLAPGLWLLVVAQLTMGAAQAGLFPASCFSVGHWIPFSNRTLACGILAVGMQVGAIAASTLTGPLLGTMHWRWVFGLYALPGIAWALFFMVRFRDRPEDDDRVNAAERALIQADRPAQMESESGDSSTRSQQARQSPTPWDRILRMPALWFLCGQQVCRASGYMFFASWFPTFLQKTRGVTISESGNLQALVFAGTLTGSFLGGMLTDWIWTRTGSLRWSRSGVGAAFLFGCAGLILGAWFVQSTELAVALLTAGSLLAAMAGPCALAATIDIGGDYVPQVYGMMNMAGNLAAAACPVLVGWLFAWTADWTVVLLVFAAIYLTGAICWALVDCRRTIDTV